MNFTSLDIIVHFDKIGVVDILGWLASPLLQLAASDPLEPYRSSAAFWHLLKFGVLGIRQPWPIPTLINIVIRDRPINGRIHPLDPLHIFLPLHLRNSISLAASAIGPLFRIINYFYVV